jgi:2-polyprenyl-3-methyl-5-hydroxy-6-metoxy-1,4-benzoquinol methylase
MHVFPIESCPICRSKDFSPFLTCTDHFVSSEQFEIKTCANCGLKITWDTADEANIGKYYQSENYVSHSNTSKGLINRIYHRVRHFMLNQKAKLIEKSLSDNKGELLDIGAGTGYFLSYMKNRGWKVTGTEKSPDARQFALSEFGIGLLPTEALFELSKESIDVITLWHVLEHIHKIEENLTAFRQLLKPGGRLVIAVPNHNSFDAKYYKKHWAAWDVPRHIWHFSPEQMKLLSETYGFKLQSIHTLPFDSFYVSILSERYKKSSLAFFKGLFFGKISWLISLFNKKKCSSVIYILGLS